MTRARRTAALGLGGLGLITALLALGLFPQEPLRRLVEGRLRGAFGPSARVGRVQVVPGRLEAVVEGLSLRGPGYALDVPRLRAALSPGTLLGRGVFLRSLEMESPRLELSPAELGAPPPAAGAPSRALLVRSLVATGGALTVSTPGGGLVSAQGIDIRGSLGAGSLELTLAGGDWRRPGSPVASLGPGRLRLQFSPLGEARLEVLEATTPRSRLRASGSLGRLASLDPHLDLETRLDLSEAALLGAPPMTGIVAGSGHWDGLGDGSGRGSLHGRGLRVGSVDVFSLEASFARAGGESRGDLTADLLGGRLQAELRQAGARARGTLRLTDLDLSAVRRASLLGLPGPGNLSARLSLDGDPEASVQLEGSGDGSWGGGGASATLHGTLSGRFDRAGNRLALQWRATAEAQGPDGPPPRVRSAAAFAQGTAEGAWPPRLEGRLEAKVQCVGNAGPLEMTVEATGRQRPDGGLDAEIFGSGLGGSWTGSLALGPEGVEHATLEGAGFRLADLVPEAAGVLGVRAAAQGRRDRVQSSAEARVEGAVWRGAALGPLVVGWTGAGADGTLSLDARDLALRGSGTIRGPRLAARLELQATPIAFLAPLLTPGHALAGHVTGIATFEAPLGSFGAGQGDARIEFLEAESQGVSLRTQRAFHVAVKPDTVAFEDVDLAGPGFGVQAAGRLGRLGASPLDVRAQARVDLARASLGGTLTRRGEVVLDLHGEGSLARPRVQGTLTGRDLFVEGSGLPPVEAKGVVVELAGDRAVLSGVVLHVGRGELTLSGAVPLAALLPGARRDPVHVAPSEEVELRATWAGIPLADVLRRPGESPVDAVLQGEAELSGGLASLQEPRLRVLVPATRLDVSDLALLLAPSTIRLEKGRVWTPGLSVSAGDSVFGLEGGADLGTGALHGTARGTLDLSVLSPFLASASLAGSAEANLSFGGTLKAPRAHGTLGVRDGSARVRGIPQALTSLDASLSFDGSTVRIDSASALVGGGSVTATGTAALAGMTPSAVAVAFQGRDMALRYPPGLKSRINADLTLTGSGGDLVLAGTVSASRGLYDIDLALEENLLAASVPPSRSALLRGIALDVRIQTENPVLVRNNIARLEATGDLSMRGDLETPALFGRLELRPDGVVYVGGQDFTIRSGSLTYDGTWNPAVSVVADKTIHDTGALEDVTVTAAVRGELLDPSIELTSDTPLGQNQLIALIATGSSKSAANEAALAGGAAAGLLVGRASQGLLRKLGLGDVSVRPELLARETSPGARFTFGKPLSPTLDLVYSLGLNDPEQRFIRLEWRPVRSVDLSAQRDDGGTVTSGAGQKLRWGGATRRTQRAEAPVRLTEVAFEGEPSLPDADLRRGLHAHPGARPSSFDLQDDADRLRDRLIRAGYIESEVGARLEDARAVFRIQAGARYRFRVEGMERPPDLGPEIRKALFGEEAEERGRALLLREMLSRGHLKASVSADTLDEDGGRTLLFRVQAGPVVHVSRVSFPGATLDSATLLAAAGGPGALLVSPAEASKKVEALYGEHRFLQARAGPAQVQERAGGLEITVPVVEGPRARVAFVRVEGSHLPADELQELTRGLLPGQEIAGASVTSAEEAVRDHYLTRGYASVRVAAALAEVGPDLGVTLSVSEGPRRTLGSVVITGLVRTRESLVRSQIHLKPGDPLDPRRLLDLERRLLDLGTFSRVSLAPTASDPSVLEIVVEEGPVLTTGYDLRYNSTDNVTALVDAEIHDLLGRGLDVGARYSRGSKIREARASLHLPALGPGSLLASAFRIEQDFPATDLFTGEAITNVQVQKGFELQENLAFKGRVNLLLGYRWRRTESTVFPEPVTIAGLTASLFQDTRDNLLDARRGRFVSLGLEFAPRFLGSDLTFVKGQAQVFLVRSFAASWTWAQAYRLGLAQGFSGQKLVFNDRFLAGGADTLRGFATNTVGPRDFLGDPTGGQAYLLLNEEVRYRRPSGIGGALFYDAGNVFDTASDLSLRLRHNAGVGLRYESPIGLLRLDLGLPLSRQQGEKAYRIFFSLGQAF